MNLNFKAIFIWVLTLSFINTYPEYLVFKKDKDLSILPISEKEHEFVYDILLKYQWPMSIANPDKKDLAKYTLAEAGPLEEKFIRSKIQEKFKDLDIAFIPQVIYELFVLSQKSKLVSLEKLIKDNFSRFPKDGILGNKKFTKYLNDKNSTLEGIYEKFRYINNLQEVRNTHFLINNLLLEFLLNKFNSTYLGPIKKYNINSQYFAQNIKDNISIIVNKDLKNLDGENFEYLQKIIKLWSVPFYTNRYIKNLDSSLFAEIAMQEYEAHTKNLELLYRVNESYDLDTEGGRYVPGKGLVNPLEYTQLFPESSAKVYLLTPEKSQEFENLITLKSNKAITEQQEKKLIEFKSNLSFLFNIPSRSISYGSSMFSGIVSDPTASAIHYFLKRRSSYLYLLKINKFSYLKSSTPLGKAHLLFRIPPLSNLVAIFAIGEYFHPRSKSYYFKNFDKSIKGIDLASIEDEELIKLIRDNINYLVLLGNPIDMNAKLSDYIAKNAIILRPSDKTEADKLIQGQKDVTALFKAMDVIYKYAKRDEELLK